MFIGILHYNTAGAAMRENLTLTQDQASAFARLALSCVQREYPNILAHVLTGPSDPHLRNPRVLHPAFYGCYDWHSAVHSHWMLARLLRLMPDLPEAPAIRAALRENLTLENILIERDYMASPHRRSFERTYGWAWLLKLAEELHTWDDPEAREWSSNLQPLAHLIVSLYLDFLPKQTYPIRVGTHPNTAFGLTFALDYARTLGHSALEQLIVERSLAYYFRDKDCPASWEPGGSDFLSPCLIEADLIRRVLPPKGFGAWLSGFLPGLPNGEPANLFTPATVADRTDPQIVHLDGLNLSRAWCMQGIASALLSDDPARSALLSAARTHAEATLPHIASGDYMGEHWLASFAVYMLS
jgi:hypothetical protein